MKRNRGAQDYPTDFARTVDIHRKRGYDSCEIFLTLRFRALRKLLSAQPGRHRRIRLIV